MRVWVDFGNSPHVALLGEVVDELWKQGDDVFLTARGDHPQTVGLAPAALAGRRRHGGRSPTRLEERRPLLEVELVTSLACSEGSGRTRLAQGSYAQAIAAARLRIPLVTMMDYEHQPANHLSFRVPRRVIVSGSPAVGRQRRDHAQDRRRKPRPTSSRNGR